MPIKYFLILLIFFLSSLIHTPAQARSKNVLALHSYHPGLSWTSKLNSGIKEILEHSNIPIIYREEYLDTKRNTDPEHLRLVFKLLQHKFKNKKFDLVIVTDNNAFEFTLQYRKKLFSEVPIVFCGVNDFHPGMLHGQKQITGISEMPALASTLNLALKIHPKTKEFIIIGGNKLPTDKITDHNIRQIRPEFPAIKFTFWNDLSAVDLKQRLKKLGPGQIIFVHGILRNEEGVLIDYAIKNRFLAEHSSVPIYGFWDFELGGGCVGGKMISARQQGREAGNLALKILQGQKADDIPIIYETPTTYMFDYKQLERFKISHHLLPEDRIIVNQPPNFYRINKTYIWLICLTIFLLLLIVAILTFNIEKRKTAESQLRKYQGRLKEIVAQRTRHLQESNSSLEKEINERIKIEGDLIKARAGLEIEVQNRTEALRQEIEQRKQAEAEIRLLDKLNSLGRVAAGIAHEVRNPLTGINSYLYSLEQLFEQLEMDEEEHGSCQQIFRQLQAASGKIEAVIKRVIDFSKPSKPRFSRIDANIAVIEAVELLSTTLRKAGISVDSKLNSSPLLCFGDPLLLEQVIVNLIDNALRAMRSQEKDKKIIIFTYQKLKNIIIEVHDSGPGIKQPIKSKIFDPFYTTKSDGTGIGLSIVKRIIADHKGKINVADSYIGGALFIINLPLISDND